MNKYVLGIDAGGTKTHGIIKQYDPVKQWSVTLGPGSLTNNFFTASENITQVARALLAKANCQATETILVCGAAGVNNNSLGERLKIVIEGLNFKQLIVTTDAQTSLYGASNGNPAIVVALGTGSVAMRLDVDGNEKQFGGWGFAAGDQGGGAYIGRELISDVLAQYDDDDFVIDEFIAEIFEIIGSSRQEILSWLTEATPTKFAELSPLVSKYIANHYIAKSVLKKATLEVEKLITSAQGNHDLPVCLIGGLASVISPLLNVEIQRQLIPAKGGSVEGALILGERYLANNTGSKSG